MSDEFKNKGLEDFCAALCLNNVEAMRFSELWFRYCHRIDDIVDNMEDGRPTTPPEEIIESYVMAAVLYNLPFYVQNRDMLFPVVLSVTNAYADSVAWEKSPVNRRRVIADVLRCCGNEMLFVVAMVVGGWSHVRKMSPMIRDRSWVLQHTEDDKPN